MRYCDNGRFGVICKVMACIGAVLLLLEPVTLLGQGGAMPGYGGPAVASRGLGRAGERGSESVALTTFATVVGTYDNGITAVGLDEKGDILNTGALYGVEASVGAFGTKTWKRRRLGLDYGGNYRHYNDKTYFNGSDHFLGLNYAQQLGRKGVFELRGLGGTTARTLGSNFGYAVGLDPTFVGAPINDVFDSRVYYVDLSGSYTRQLTPRSSVSFGGGAISMRRRSKVLIGANGVRANADYVRRVTRRLSVGAGFSYFKLEFPRVFGDSNIQTFSAQASRTIGRRLLVAGSLGVMRMELTGIRQVTLDPVVAELLGQFVGREAFHTRNYLYIGSITVTHRMRRSDLSIAYNRGPSIGNGIILSGKIENITASYNRSVTGRFNLGGAYLWSRLSGTGSYGGRFSSSGHSVNGTYRLTDYASLTFTAMDRLINVGADTFSRRTVRISGGVSFHPRGFSLWPK